MFRRNIIVIFMSIELMLNAVNINLVAFSSQLQNAVGQVFAIFVICVAAAESGRRAGHHPRVLPEQGNGEHRRDEPDAVVRRDEENIHQLAICRFIDLSIG